VKGVPLRRIAGASVGGILGILYGFWTMLETGGGHANFTWIGLFLVSEGCGLFFLVAGFIVVDLRTATARLACGTLLGINLCLTAFVVFADFPEGTRADLGRTWTSYRSLFLESAAVHFVPLAIIWTIFLLSVFRWSRSERTVQLP